MATRTRTRTTTTLLEYLREPNPVLDCSKSSTGTNTFNARWDPITGLEDWADFNIETLMESYGHILLHPVPPLPETSPPLTDLEKQIFTEDTFETVLKRDTMPKVSAALRVAWPLYYSTHDSQDIAEISKGAKARRGTAEEDDRFYADWAGIRMCETSHFGGYRNLCPGETKLASKWNTSEEGQNRTDYAIPFSQIQTYCGRQWGVCRGYIITPEELAVSRVSRESIGPGLAASRATRNVSQRARDQPSHSRTFSVETVSSGFQAMSLDTGSSFSEANPNIEYRPLQFKSIPWNAAGEEQMTIKLALWWLHMETKKDLSVQEDYPQPNRKSDNGQGQPLHTPAGVLPLPSSIQSTKRTGGKGKRSG